MNEEKSGIGGFWARLSTPARWSLAGMTLVLLGAVLAISTWTLRVEYGVLFSKLSEGDAASITTELKRLKTPYRLDENGSTILVPADQVYETRLALTSSGAPLSGGVGFELFDNQGIGATEQSQRITYQRALQGELARTIGALDPVRQARVHLVMPETTLFKRDREQARAAVVLSFDAGGRLRAEQVSGIQRLVAASVQGLDPSHVVVSDERGVVLSMSSASGDGGAGATELHLAMKREVESYFTAKIARLLDNAFGAGKAIVSVDVALNFDEITRTRQELLPAKTGDTKGYVVREQNASSALEGRNQSAFVDGAGSGGDSSANRVVQYEFSKRVEEVITAPGGISRLSVGVIVPPSIQNEQQESIKALVRVAAGIDDARGDAVVVQALDELGVGASGTPGASVGLNEPVAAAEKVNLNGSSWWQKQRLGGASVLYLLVAGAFAVGMFMYFRTRSRARVVTTTRLSEAERAELLQQLRASLRDPVITPKGTVV